MDYIKNFYNSLGCYPLEYNKAVHGPYDSGRYYGKPDTHVMDVKISEFPRWLSRRKFDPYSIITALARWRDRWDMRYNFPYKAKSTRLLQICFIVFLYSYCNSYKTTRKHKNYKYHW